MSDKFTPGELVILAEACGHTVHLHPNLPSRLLCEDGTRWHPDTDANQRDEVVEAMVRLGNSVIVNAFPAKTKHGIWMTAGVHLGGELVAVFGHTAPGAAVCRVALEAIGKK